MAITSLSSISLHPITTINRRMVTKPPAATDSNKWWTPLTGSSNKSVTETSDPDNNNNNNSKGKSRFTPGCFTEEKAKALRIKTSEMSNFHDIMYHSAIASRLASDVSGGR